jgi:hypothetical protein
VFLTSDEQAGRVLPPLKSVPITVRKTIVIRTVGQTASPKHMAKTRLKLVTPAIVKRTVTPKRLPNKDLRTREHLTEAEVERLMKAAQRNRYSHRDATMVLHRDSRWSTSRESTSRSIRA